MSNGFCIHYKYSMDSYRLFCIRSHIQSLGRRSSEHKRSYGSFCRHSYTSRMNGSISQYGSTEFCTEHGSNARNELESNQTDGGSSEYHNVYELDGGIRVCLEPDDYISDQELYILECLDEDSNEEFLFLDELQLFLDFLGSFLDSDCNEGREE